MKFKSENNFSKKIRLNIEYEKEQREYVSTGYCSSGIPNLDYVTTTPSATNLIKNRKVNYKSKDMPGRSTGAEQFLFSLKSSKMKKSSHGQGGGENKLRNNKVSFKTVGLSFAGLFKPSVRNYIIN